MTFLLIDPSRVMRDIERELLQAHWPAAQVFDAPTLSMASPYMEDRYKPIDLILLGWQSDALDTIAGLREALYSTPVLLVAPVSAQDAILAAIKAGVSNYLYKPFTPDVLIEKIRTTLDQAGLRPAA